VQLVLEDPEVSESFAHEQSMRYVADQLGFDAFATTRGERSHGKV
jgi:hypothetical protein